MVATAVEPDVLIIDEVLAVGDINFREKCMNKITEMQKTGVTVILVSHSLGDVERVCNKAMWIHQGKIMGYGDAKKVAADYQAYH